MINRREFLTKAATLAASIALGEQAASAAQVSKRSEGETRPNILVFMPDQQQGVTVLPEHPCQTPNLDRFSREGLLFTKAYCPAPHCCPSRASFMTGLYPSEHGVFNNVDTDTAIHADPYPGIQYFSQFLLDAGYELGYSGKWHVGHTLRPEDVGWTPLGQHPYIVNQPIGKDHRSSFWANAKSEYEHPTARANGEVKRPGWGNVNLYGDQPKGYETLSDYTVVRDVVHGIGRLAAS